MTDVLEQAVARFQREPDGGLQAESARVSAAAFHRVVVALTSSPPRSAVGCRPAVNGGRLRMYAADGSAEYAELRRQIELTRVAYRQGRQMSFYVDPSDGHDDYVVSLALVVAAGRDGIAPPRIARGRISLN